MLDVLVISPFRYALQKQSNKVRVNKLDGSNEELRIHSVYALPADIEEGIYGQQYDFAYIDKFYSNEEIGRIREHIRGQQYKQIKTF